MTLNPYFDGPAAAAAEGINTEMRFSPTLMAMPAAVRELMSASEVETQQFLDSDQVAFAGQTVLAHSS